MLVSGHFWSTHEKAKWQAVGTQSIFKAYIHERVRYVHMELARKQCGGVGGAGNGLRRWVDSPRRRFIKACSSGIEQNFVKGLLCGRGDWRQCSA